MGPLPTGGRRHRPSIAVTVRRCLFFLGASRWRWGALVPIAVLGAAAEAVSAGALFGLIKIVEDPGSVARLPVASTVYLLVPWRTDRGIVLTFTVLLVVFYLLKNGIQLFQAYATNRLVAESTAALSQRLLRGYLRAPYAFYLHRNSAELIRNVWHSSEVVFRAVMAPAVAIAFETVVVLAIAGVLLAIAPLVTLVISVLLGGAALVFVRASRTAVARWGIRADHLTKEIIQSLQQTLHAIKEIKVLGREAFFDEAFDRLQRQLVRVRHYHATLAAVPRMLIETLFVGGAFVLIALVVLLGNTGPEVLPILGLYAYAGFRVIPSMNRIMLYVNDIRHGAAAVEDLYADLLTVAADEGPDALEHVTTSLPFDDRIELAGVSYVYEGGAAPVLRDVDLVIRRGESVGIVGLTGAGKSTLVDLLLGLLTPTYGRITVDGRDLATHRRAWQRRIGYVPQAIVLVDDTLRRNVALGLPDAQIDPARLAAALRVAQLEDFVATLPAGLETVVGERGIRFSGGERQRVGIARALYRAPDVLVFDEATSSLDNRTEADLVRALETLPAPRTLIVIAHRLSTVRHCDRLVYLKDGRVDDIGSYEALLARNPGFRTIAMQVDEDR
jgi:ATP-binding cassette, subfamily B, bacterial PglK